MDLSSSPIPPSHYHFAPTAEKEKDEYEQAVDQIRVMLHQGADVYPCVPNYTNENCLINDEWRQKICEWAFEVVDHFEYSRELASLTMSYLDRYMSRSIKKGAPLSRKNFQLAAIACIFLAVKVAGSSKAVHNGKHGLNIAVLVKLGRDRFSTEDIVQMERQILADLRWKMNPPTAICFIYHFMYLFPSCGTNGVVPENVRATVFEFARYLSELSVCISSLAIETSQSIIAFASVLNAMECIGTSLIPEDVRITFVNVLMNITDLSPASKEVYEVCQKLSEICPASSSNETYVSDEQENIRNSPSCVSRLSGCRKRTRDSL